jgi:hypothetical protein
MITLMIGALILIAAIGLWLWWSHIGVFTADRFERAAWFRPISDAQSATCYRGGMARDIQKRLLKPGMSKADVEGVLGAPNDIGRANEYRYALGMCSGFGIDYDDLHIYFNERGALERSDIIQH